MTQQQPRVIDNRWVFAVGNIEVGLEWLEEHRRWCGAYRLVGEGPLNWRSLGLVGYESDNLRQVMAEAERKVKAKFSTE